MPKIDVLLTSGKKTKSLNLPAEIFAAKIRPQLMAQAVKVYLANQRSTPAKTKSRGQVVVSKRKIWRQKGTGRARHGSRNAPIFVGGAKAHGPTITQNFSLKLTKKMKRLSLFSALTQKLNDNQVLVVSGLDKLESKTKAFDQVYQKLTKSSKELLVLTDQPIDSIKRGSKNLPYLDLSSVKNLNTYQTLKAKTLIFTLESINTLKEHYFSKKSLKN